MMERGLKIRNKCVCCGKFIEQIEGYCICCQEHIDLKAENTKQAAEIADKDACIAQQSDLIKQLQGSLGDTRAEISKLKEEIVKAIDDDTKTEFERLVYIVDNILKGQNDE